MQLLKAFYSPLFLKIKFKGKGYYIYKNKRNTITPQFGYAHRLYLYSYFTSVKFLSKTSIIIFGYQLQDLIQTGLGIKQMRPINIFTGRGVRFSNYSNENFEGRRGEGFRENSNWSRVTRS